MTTEEAKNTRFGWREHLIIMAAFLHGASLKRIYANCSRILRQALFWAGLLDDQLKIDGQWDVENPIIEDWYRILISMTKHNPESERLLEGFGNLGNEEYPPSLCIFTACRLTPLGREFAERLFNEHPEFKGAKGKFQRKGCIVDPENWTTG